MAKISFDSIKKKINRIDQEISALQQKKGKLEKQLKEACDHPSSSWRGSGAKICEKCDKTLDYIPPKCPTAF